MRRRISGARGSRGGGFERIEQRRTKGSGSATQNFRQCLATANKNAVSGGNLVSRC